MNAPVMGKAEDVRLAEERRMLGAGGASKEMRRSAHRCHPAIVRRVVATIQGVVAESGSECSEVRGAVVALVSWRTSNADRIHMPVFYSLRHPRWDMGPDLNEMTECPGVVLKGDTLGELLEQVREVLGVHIVPADPPKYFKYFEPGDAERHVLVDIHIQRDGIEICPKQDLAFPLLPSDIVEAGVLVC